MNLVHISRSICLCGMYSSCSLILCLSRSVSPCNKIQIVNEVTIVKFSGLGTGIEGVLEVGVDGDGEVDGGVDVGVEPAAGEGRGFLRSQLMNSTES